MEFRQLNTFLHVARYKNFSRAAEKLGYSQSAVTVQIKQLEEELGTQLFDRIGRQVELTDQGLLLVEKANRILDEMNEIREAVNQSDQTSPVLKVGTIESMCFYQFPNLLKELRQRHPGISMEIITGTPETLLKKMDQGDLDLAYILDKPRYNNNWHKALEIREEMIFVASPGFEELKDRQLDVSDLLDEPFFLTEKKVNYRDALDQYFAARNVQIAPVLEAPNTDFLVEMIKKSKAISLLPLFSVKEEIINGTLIPLEVKDFQIHMYRQIFYHRRKWKTAPMKDFIELAKQMRE